MLTEWQRLERIVKWAGLSVNSFGKEIGLSRSEALYQIKRGHNGISRDLADTICRRYPQISKGWLLAEEGQMFLDHVSLKVSRTPFYDFDVERCVLEISEYERAGELMLPMFDGCDFAAVYYGKAMCNEAPSGSIVVFNKVELDEVVPGDVCLVVNDKISVLRRVVVASDPTMLRLEADAGPNTAFEIPRDGVLVMYRLMGVVQSRKF